MWDLLSKITGMRLVLRMVWSWPKELRASDAATLLLALSWSNYKKNKRIEKDFRHTCN